MHNSKPLKIGDIIYPSISEASRCLDLTEYQIKKNLNDKNDFRYKYLNSEELKKYNSNDDSNNNSGNSFDNKSNTDASTKIKDISNNTKSYNIATLLESIKEDAYQNGYKKGYQAAIEELKKHLPD